MQIDLSVNDVIFLLKSLAISRSYQEHALEIMAKDDPYIPEFKKSIEKTKKLEEEIQKLVRGAVADV